MTIIIGNNDPRVSYSVSQGATQTSFAVPFEFFDNADLNVYVDSVLKTITTHYTVSGGSGSTGTVTISVTGATGGSTVIITRSISQQRTTDFPTSGPFNISSLNTELDRIIAINADLQDEIDRSIRLPDFDAEQSMVLPTAANRASKLVSFDSNGALLVDSSSNLNLVLGTATIATILSATDIDLKPAGGQVNILGTGGEQRILFDNAANATMQYFQNSNITKLGVTNPTGTRTINLPDASGTVALTNQNTIAPTGDFTVDASGDIILDADDSQVFLKNNGTTRLTFQLGSSPQIQANGAGLQINNSSSSIDFKSANSIYDFLTSTGDQAIQLLADNTPQIQYYQNSNTLKLEVASLDGSRTLTLPNATDTLVGKATTDTLTNKTLTSPVLNTGVSGTAIKDEDDMSSNSASHLATQQSIKAYVDSSVAGVPTGDITSVVAGTGLSGGGTSGAVTVNIDSTVTTLTGSQTLTNKTLTSPTLTSPVLNTGVSGTAIKDEDDLSSNSATHLATQQSIKAYVDTQVAGGGAGNLSTVLGIGNTTSGNNIVFGDSSSASDDRLVFGAGSDLSIYHDGSHSYISDQGTGHLKIFAESFFLNNAGDTEQMIGATVNGAVDLFYDGSKKLETTSSGVTVTGNIANASGDFTLDVAGDIILDADGADIIFKDGGTQIGRIRNVSSGEFTFQADVQDKDIVFNGNDGGSTITALTLDMSEGGKAAFNAGATFGNHLEIDAGSSGMIDFGDLTGGYGRLYADSGGTYIGSKSNDDLILRTNNVEKVRIDTSGNLGIGLSSNRDSTKLDVLGDITFGPNASYYATLAYDAGGGHLNMTSSDGGFRWLKRSGPTEWMRITPSAGHVYIGHTSGLNFGTGTTAGITFDPNGALVASRSGDSPLYLQRSSSNGNVISIYKDTSFIGGIAVASSDNVQIKSDAADHAGLEFATHKIEPLEAGSGCDGTIDMGSTSARFHTGYFSNGTSSSSDQNEKRDIAELTATEIAVSKRLAKTFRTFRRIDAVQAKGNDARTHTGTIAQQVHAAFAAEGLDAAKYGMYMSDTWTNDDGNEQTRLGIRYEQLLSFISAGAEQRLTNIETRLAALEG